MTSVAALSPAVAKPAHVPDSLVYDFDLFADPGLLANPHDRILKMLKTAPAVFWTPRQGGHWIFLSHAANFEGSRDWEDFSNEVVPMAKIKALLAAMPPGTPHIPLSVPINVDPPDHAKYRAPLAAPFGPKAIQAMRDSIRALAVELIEKIRPQGQCEFMSAVAEPLPVQVFLKMLGLPLERLAEYRALVRDHLSTGTSDMAQVVPKLHNIIAAMRDTFVERREHPKDDVISLLWRSKIDGQDLTMDDMENYGVLLFIAGLDTVMNGMGFGVRHLAQNPDLQDTLRKEPSRISDATEELLRRYTFTVPPRRVARDLEFQGASMRQGDIVYLLLAGADLDAKEFVSPERFDLDRENNTHIAFNAGPHRCLGSHLARAELQILYEEMLARLPTFRLDPAQPTVFHGGHVIGIDSLHLLWGV
jgi:cytochrome P450